MLPSTYLYKALQVYNGCLKKFLWASYTTYEELGVYPQKTDRFYIQRQ